jgi:hypothetical protein
MARPYTLPERFFFKTGPYLLIPALFYAVWYFLPAERTIIFLFGPYALIPLLGYAAWMLWHHYIQLHNIYNAEWTLMEVVLPKLATKSPQSMEVIFGTFNQTYAGTWWTRLTQGTLRTWFSLEIVSLEGRVHFFIRTLKLFYPAVEAAIYGEFPTAKVMVVEDYMKKLKYGKHSDLDVYLWELKLEKEDPYPIRTYVDYGLDKEGVENEYQTDPTTPIIEYLSALGPDEYGVVQILVQAAKKRYHKHDGTKGDWKDEGKDLIDEIVKEKTGAKEAKDGVPDFGAFKLNAADIEAIKAIDRSTSKNGYDCGIRLMYAAKKSAFRLDHRLGLRSMFHVFNSFNLNSFKLKRDTSKDNVFLGWIGWNKYKEESLKREMFDACRLRSYFYPPHEETPFVLNSEELATVYHFSPGASVGAGVEKVESKSLEPPLELPV